MPDNPSKSMSPIRRGFIVAWKQFCQLVVKTFYSKFEVTGSAHIPNDQGIIFCVNHVNALIDAVVLQAATTKNVRPLARSGLFKNPVLKPILNMIGAVPIYRRKTEETDTSGNLDTFSKCYELLGQNETLVIFPEGQSHSDSYVHDLKTGVARMALGAIEANGVEPVVIPVGLTFVRKRKSRTEVLVHYGAPIDLKTPKDMDDYDASHLVTDRVKAGIESVTLNAPSWQDIDLVTRLEGFFSMRHGKRRTSTLKQRFQSLQRIIEAQHLLNEYEPDKVRTLMSKLRLFERLCKACGINNYHLGIKYKPVLLVLYTLRTLGIVLIGFPVAMWGILNSYIPYKITTWLTQKVSKDTDQHDTAQVLIGMGFFGLFWGLQSYYVFQTYGLTWLIIYVISLLIGAAVALSLRGEYRRTLENLKVFFLFVRKKDLKSYLETKRHDLEIELAQMVRIAKRLSKSQDDDDEDYKTAKKGGGVL
jgi:1-acyl-sn-glycerol-3-phosphate acyltransferase